MLEKKNVVEESTKTVTYEFADGSVSVVEVSADVADFIEVLNREEANYERKERYWCKVRLDLADYEGDWFADKSPNPQERLLIEEEEKEHEAQVKREEKRVNEFLKTLTPTQKRRLMIRMENPNTSLRDIARMEGLDIKTITECFNAIKKKYNKFFNSQENTPSKPE